MSSVQDARLRYALYYLGVLAEAQQLYTVGGESARAALEILDKEWVNIRLGRGYAEVYAGEDDLAATACSDYADIGAHLLDLRLTPRERVSWLTAASASSERLGDVGASYRHLNSLGLAYKSLGDFDRAVTAHESQLAASRLLGDEYAAAAALTNLGVVHTSVHENARAVSYYEEALDIFRRTGTRR